MLDDTCVWPRCASSRSDEYPAIPMCRAHVMVVVHQVNITRDPSRAIPTPRVKPQERWTKVGEIYYLRIGKLIKIGYALTSHVRLTAYPPNSILLAIHPGTRDDERQLHKRFAEELVSGKEWFAETRRISEHIASLDWDHPPMTLERWRALRRVRATTKRPHSTEGVVKGVTSKAIKG